MEAQMIRLFKIGEVIRIAGTFKTPAEAATFLLGSVPTDCMILCPGKPMTELPDIQSNRGLEMLILNYSKGSDLI